MDSWGIGWALEDHEFMMKIFPSLHEQMISDEADSRLKKQCSLTFRLLCMYCVGNIREKGIAPPSPSKDLDPMQKYVLELLMDDLERTLENVKQTKMVVTRGEVDNSRAIFEYHKAEHFLHQILVTLSISTQTISCEQFLTDVKTIQLLLRIHHVGTPRLKRLALRYVFYNYL